MEMEQVMACLLAEIKAEIRASQAKMGANQATTDANLKIITEMRAWRKDTTTCQEKTDATDLVANPEEKESATVHKEVPKEEAAVKPVRALKKRHGDRHLAVEGRGKPKKRTQGDGGSRKKLAAARRGMTRRVVPARRKGRGHKGPAVEKRGRKGQECNNGIRNRGARRQLRLRKERTTGNGISGRSRRQELRLGSVKTLYEALGQTLELVVVKGAVGISGGLWKVSDWTLWRGRPLPNERSGCTRSRSNGCRSIDHSRNFCPHRSKKLDDGDPPGPTCTL
jgi:hypothetical protein